jgi:mono/diheme cytochrome c family protein
MQGAGKVVAAALLAIGLTDGSAAAVEFGVAEMGRGLAETWCASCHLIGNQPGDTAPATTEAPPFTDIAQTIDAERREALAVWLATPHGKMPSLSLTRAEIADILAYIESLANKP